jgi:dihydroorotase
MMTPGCSTGRRRRPHVARARAHRPSSGHSKPLEEGEPANWFSSTPTPAAGRGRRLNNRSRGTPRGRTLPVRVVATFLRGRPTVLDGALVEAVTA